MEKINVKEEITKLAKPRYIQPNENKTPPPRFSTLKFDN